MKKILSVLAIAAFVSCNNETASTEVKPVDTPVVAPAPEATVAPVTDSTTKVMPDSSTAK